MLDDPSGRRINYLRLSVTDRCNLRCRYCVPSPGYAQLPRSEILRYEELARLTGITSELGVTAVRLTGGEPLVRPKLTALIELLRRQVPRLEDLAMTTNGQRLARLAPELVRAGLDRVNVSLDTLRPERYRRITGGELSPVLAGLSSAREVGLKPLKLNVVLLRRLNDDEAVDFARLTFDQEIAVRFIEYMPLGGEQVRWVADQVITEAELRDRIEAALGPLLSTTGPKGSRGGDSFCLSGAAGTISFISPLTHPFCGSCNRLRLTADGRLRLCLLSDQTVDLRAPLRGGATDDQIAALIQEALRSKPRRHHLGASETEEGAACRPTTPMCTIGG